ncbi:acetyl-CoA carboxylase [Polychytrium aggregatum]|uniref:acetyl-CoA carboxylase n=1 Tax=Polychytrium aggregatum TaxID=110093 RepID=UPI0022FDCA66|nr:acetyl-CoA carboxylase [Polychytrium aggregatum]KAI9204928.1 acetyl-CoA carboxylase [Polychytrium aggregatum]
MESEEGVVDAQTTQGLAEVQALNSPPSVVRDFVLRSKGNTVITKVLIANNGMAAVKAIRSIRKWSYETFGDEHAIKFTVMCTPEDLRVNSEFLRMADQYVEVPGGTSNNNYSNVDLIVDIAERTGVHAVWVGWGFASENPILADKLSALKSKPVFIGPPPAAMRALGDKIASTVVAQSAQVPCVSWSGDGLVTDAYDEHGRVYVPSEIFRQATTVDVDEGLAHAERIGFPVMIKASEGGGGKGIRLVDDPKNFKQAFVQVQREIPGSPIFIMRVVRGARHLEVQLLADQYGNAIALFGRDCSVQRRHQKIIEEAPVTVAPQETLHEMEQAAVRLAKLVGYVSAGTVEYLYDVASGKYYFLELNPRLQVEHPTTEMVSGVNIPAAQLQVAMGIPLSCIRDIRILYGLTPTGVSEIDFDFSKPGSLQIQRKPSPKGHVIAARITAENPEAGFKPNSGKVLELNFRSNSNVWGYFSVNSSGGVHEFADSQFGHIFSYGETRENSRKNLVMALKELSIRGDFRTTVEYLIKLLEDPTFVDNGVTTSWLDGIIAKKVEIWQPDSVLISVCGALVKAHNFFEHNKNEYLKMLEKGQSPGKHLLTCSHVVDFICNSIQYRISAAMVGSETFRLTVNNSAIFVIAKKLADGGLLILLDGKSHVVYSKEEPHGTQLILDGQTCLLEKENDPTKLRSPSPGKLVRYLIEDGSHINAGEAFAEIEVMKMYMPLVASESGHIKFTKPAGSVLSNGDIIGSMVLDDPSLVKKAVLFEGVFPAFGPPSIIGDKAHHRFRSIKKNIESVLAGYDYQGDYATLIRSLIELLRDNELPYHELFDVLSSLSGRIPGKLDADLHAELDKFRESGEPFSSTSFTAHIEATLASLPLEEQSIFAASVAPFQTILDLYKQGQKHHERAIIAELIEQFLTVEELFHEKRYEDVLLQLRDKYKGDLGLAHQIALAQSKGNIRAELMLSILDLIRSDNDGEAWKAVYMPFINRLANVSGRSIAKVSLRARELLIYNQLATYEERSQSTFSVLNSAMRPGFDPKDPKTASFSYDRLSQLITSNHAILDVLPSFFYHENAGISSLALYTYVVHTHQAYSITSVKHNTNVTPVVFQWEFVLRPSFKSSDPVSSLRSPTTTTLGSFSDLSALGYDSKTHRKGFMCAFDGLDDVVSKLPAVIEEFGEGKLDIRRSLMNVLSVAVRDDSDAINNDQKAHDKFGEIVQSLRGPLRAKSIRRITFMVIRENQFPRYFTFKEAQDYHEDQVIRHIEPAMAYQLELQRLTNFDIKPIFIDDRRLHIYHAVGKKNTSDIRFFVRAIVYPGQVVSKVSTHDFLVSEGNRILTDIMDALEIVGATYPNTDCNHLFINFIPTFELDTAAIEQSLRDFVDRHGARLWKLRVTTAEIRFIRQSPNGSPKPIRVNISSVSGFVTKVEIYQEVRDATGAQKLMSLTSPPGSLHHQLVHSPYAPKEAIQPKRYKAHLLNTTYIYDFPELFRRSLEKTWIKYMEGAPIPNTIMNLTELVLDESGENLVETFRAPGSNTIGMVAWKAELFTPEYPEGREIIIVANDVTFNVGSFGTAEDKLFYLASQYARKHGIPRIYISANSGARIGLADEVANRFKIAWVDPNVPSKGFKYLYLDETDYNTLVVNSKDSPSCNIERVEDDGEIRYKIVDIIGRVHGLGVENLQGSGMIAGETSRAYEESFTLTLVTCRSVGIGAYLVRLGQRVIQVEYTPVILTGAGALNKVLGREVYTSNLQLGGTQIMFKNGVSHLVAQNDMAGVGEILNWLTYVPKHFNAPLPIIPATDSIERDVETVIPNGPYDPRQLIAGYANESSEWIPGFFDKDSFTETLAGWAKGVVVGRARLGGIPVGVVAVETRTTEQIIWADPANENSVEQTVVEAGQVWYPNSAYKTAQAINDFNKGEQLPLIIFANWRGFSGGQSDMYKEVLKYGAYIVDALRDYKQPVFIYIVGELRGGAWVVLDPTINPEMMEMYAEENARGGVLEPEGIVEIKFRKPQLLAAIERLDETYRNLKQRLTSPDTPAEEKPALKAQFEQREKELLPLFHQAAVQFADLHDKPGRMVAKKVINQSIPWRESRRHFYWRLLRRVSEDHLIKEMRSADSDLDRKQARELLASWFSSDQHTLQAYDSSDLDVVRWISTKRVQIDERLAKISSARSYKDIEQLVRKDANAALDGFLGVFKHLEGDKKKAVLEALSKLA